MPEVKTNTPETVIERVRLVAAFRESRLAVHSPMIPLVKLGMGQTGPHCGVTPPHSSKDCAPTSLLCTVRTPSVVVKLPSSR